MRKFVKTGLSIGNAILQIVLGVLSFCLGTDFSASFPSNKRALNREAGRRVEGSLSNAKAKPIRSR